MKIYDLRIKIYKPMYLVWKEEAISDFSEKNVEHMYNEGFVFTRKGKGVMNQTRSLRIDLNKFDLSSENRRILGKTEDLNLFVSLIPYENYEWMIHKMGKEFYAKKFGEKTFSAQKIKELITDKTKSNFNKLFVYSTPTPPTPSRAEGDNDISLLPRGSEEGVAEVGYCIALETKNILHYCYPFYRISDFGFRISNLGMGMMLKAIVWAKENGRKYIYLGSFQRPTDGYKLQFSGLEWFDGKEWNNDLGGLKNIYV